MNYKIGKKLQWKDIKIGQAFYFKGCHGLGVKVDEAGHFFPIDLEFHSWDPGKILFDTRPDFTFYDIPKKLKECLNVSNT